MSTEGPCPTEEEVQALLEHLDLAPRPQRLATAPQALPLVGRALYALAQCSGLGAGVQPAAQCPPAAHQRLMRDLVGRAARLILHDDQQAPHHQRAQRGLLPDRPAEQRGLGLDDAGPVSEDQPLHDALHRAARGRRQAPQHTVRVPLQRARDAADLREGRRGDLPPLLVARAPQLGQRELEQGLQQHLDQRVRLEGDPALARRAEDHLPHRSYAQRAEHVEFMREIQLQPGQAGDARQAVAADGHEQAHAAPPDTAVAGNPDPNGCIGRSKCDCYARGCAVLTTSCWCPSECGVGVCVCGGGAFLGCAPPESKCRNAPVCNAAGVAVGQDERGCFRCAYESDCDKALAQLLRTCRLTAGSLSACSCSCNPSCVTRCINSVVFCQEIGCGFSTLASCTYPTGSFEACVAACQ